MVKKVIKNLLKTVILSVIMVFLIPFNSIKYFFNSAKLKKLLIFDILAWLVAIGLIILWVVKGLGLKWLLLGYYIVCLIASFVVVCFQKKIFEKLGKFTENDYFDFDLTEEEAKKKYLTLMKHYHPDNAETGDEKMAIRVQEHYDRYKRMKGIK